VFDSVDFSTSAFFAASRAAVLICTLSLDAVADCVCRADESRLDRAVAESCGGAWATLFTVKWSMRTPSLQ
jgi:hypothetical protein